MILIPWKAILLLLVWIKGQVAAQQQPAFNHTCSNVKGEIRVSFPEWPFSLDCERMVDNVDPNQCFVQTNQSTFELASTQQFHLNSSKTFLLHYLASNNECWSKNITVQLRPLSTASAFDNVNNAYMANASEEHRLLLGESVQFDCFPLSLDNDGESRYFLALPPDSTYIATWWRAQRYPNGTLSNQTQQSPSFTNFTEFVTRYTGAELIAVPYSPQSILKYQASYKDPAVYSCQLEYNGETAFITHLSICVQNEISDTLPEVTCTENHIFHVGKNFSVQCSAFSSNVMIKPGEMEVEWRKKNADSVPICTYSYENTNVGSPSDGKYECTVAEFSNPPAVCFEHIPSDAEEEQHLQTKSFAVILSIKNMQENDEEKYYVRLRYQNQTSADFEVNISYDRQDELRETVIILVSILAVLIIISLVVLLVWYYWIQIQLFIRRHMGKYDKDNKEYVAFLSYVYSDDLSEVTRKRTFKIVRCVQEKLKDMNYSFYDSHKDFQQGCTIENLLKHLNESHRMIIVLTDAYVKERWSQFEAQQGFFNMMNNKTKLIFIRTPGAREWLKKSVQKGDSFSTKINEALKASRNIRWTEKMSESRFEEHLQYALPNLNRSSSTSNFQNRL